jgi:hypothetical protein
MKLPEKGEGKNVPGGKPVEIPLIYGLFAAYEPEMRGKLVVRKGIEPLLPP